MIKKKTKYLISMVAVVVVFLTAIFQLSFQNNEYNYVYGDNEPYLINVNRSITIDEISDEVMTINTTNGNPISFAFDSGTVEYANNGVITLLNDGFFYNDTKITGIKNINLTLSRGNVELRYGNDKNDLTLGYEILNTNNEDDISFDISLNTPSDYFRLEVISGPSLLKGLSISYSCSNDGDSSILLKTAVFADIQLCAKENGPDGAYYANAGNTVHAYIALKNHFALCKEQNVDVILMNGDIVNNAISEYYDLFEEALESVYGNDESQYPEIIYNMGNHEWWDLKEKETEDAVYLFKQHARIDNVVEQTSVTYSLDNTETLPTYYKVINGIPFLVISGENPSGLIGNEMRNEIEGWLDDISNLESVRHGGPIYVAYHCALHTTLTHGNGAFEQAYGLEEILENYPQAIVFTGDTHYSGVNERAINQVDFTAINIGSSSYSRMDKMSATMSGDEHFDNMQIRGGKTSDLLIGNASYKHEYTPTIHIMKTYNNLNTTIDRYFSNEDETNPIHINKTWNIPQGTNKSNFKYTNDRFENVESARELYRADGVSWSNDAEVRFGVTNEKMTIIFPDTNEYHYTEHFKIEVTGDSQKTYDVVSNYYKYNLEPESLYFVLDDLPDGDSYSVKVTAYDYFDNPSLNFLTSSLNDMSICVDEVDNSFINAYSEVSTRVFLDDHAQNSNSSIECYYNGVKRNEWGAPIGQLIRDVVPGKTDGGENISEYLSIGNQESCEVILKAKIKNLSNNTLKFGYTLYGADYTYKNAQIVSTGKTVNANSDWVNLEWNITQLFPDIMGRSDVTYLALIVSGDGYGYNPNGYEMHFLVDDLDVVAGEHIDILEEPSRYNIEMCNYESGAWRGTGSAAEVSFVDTYGQDSFSSRKITFVDSEGLPSVTDSNNYATVNASFNLRTTLGANNIDAKNCILSFDIKLSEEFYNSGNSAKHRFSLKIECDDANWTSAVSWCDFYSGGAAYFDIENTDNGWIHVEIDLSTKPNFNSLAIGTNVITFGFFGLTTTTQETAYVIMDNIALIDIT